MAVITLILGGTKSGKTTFAQDRAAARQRELRQTDLKYSIPLPRGYSMTRWHQG